MDDQESTGRFLKELAVNFWHEWHPEAGKLFQAVDPELWLLADGNPVRFLTLRKKNPLDDRQKLKALYSREDFRSQLKKVRSAYLTGTRFTNTFVSRHYPELQNKTVAYFSMEYGIEGLRIYSGGLGILSGDHLRGASDLGLCLVGVGLFYLQGYYEQVMMKTGVMHIAYESLVPDHGSGNHIPFSPVTRPGSGDALVIHVPVADRQIAAKVWRVRVGRSDLLLLDTNIKENTVHDRHITRRLYASEKHYEDERKRRIEQEIMLGIGGVTALREAGYSPVVYHLNEGHAAFAVFEVIRRLMKNEQLSFETARERAARMIGFTTHTPVPEGNEHFSDGLVRKSLDVYLNQFLSSEEQELILAESKGRYQDFDMTQFALLFSGVCRNGVSRIHGEVCRKIWGHLWGDREGKQPDFIPIESITNGVHVPYWQAPSICRLVAEAGGISRIDQILNRTLWEAHQDQKGQLIAKVRERVSRQFFRAGTAFEDVRKQVSALLDSDGFIIGFARRFAFYKRTTLILEDEKRLFSFLETAYRRYGKPVQILFAGKPHPNNQLGRERVKMIYETAARLRQRCSDNKFKAEILFIENYDIELGRCLTAGADIWLNNPIRPHEASGTSGMKAGMNGVLNVSIPDGWAAEGITTGDNGWLFGKGDEKSAAKDRTELFRLLEQVILPVYFDRPNPSLPFSPRWVAWMKRSIQTVTPRFSIERTLKEYIEKMYLSAARSALASSRQQPAA